MKIPLKTPEKTKIDVYKKKNYASMITIREI